jgi:hypothetical protein
MGRRGITPGAGGGHRTGGGSAAPAVITIDVAHPPMSSAEAEQALDELLRTLAPGGPTRIVRVIHGYGSGGKGGTLRTAVRNWAYRRRGKFALVLPGEEYSPFLPEVRGHLSPAGDATLSDLADTTEGMTLLFLP